MSISSPTSPVPDQHHDFETEAVEVLKELRQALSKVVQRLEPQVSRPADLRRRLNLDWKLSWSVFNATTAEDPRALASLLPGKRAMQRLLTAASGQQGITPTAIDRVQSAFDRFERIVAHHAGSRQAFEAMVCELGDDAESTPAMELKHKRAAFRANSVMWGQHMKSFWATKILHPSATEDMLDCVLIRGVIGLRRTKRAVPIHTVSHHWRTTFAGDSDEPETQPLDPREVGPEAVGLMRDFCSQPVRKFRCVASKQGYRRFELDRGLLGRAGEVTYFLGDARRADSATLDKVDGSEIMLGKVVDIPIQTCVIDMLMHESIWDDTLPELKVYSVPLDGSTEFRPQDEMPLAERVTCLGKGIELTASPLFPRYDEMLSYAMQRMNWNPDEFRVFRCKIEYPVLYTRIRMAFRHSV